MVGQAAKRALAAASLKTSTGATARSNGAPDVICLIKLGGESKWMVSLGPEARSNCGPSSFNEPIMEPPAKICSSAACMGATADRTSIAAAAASQICFMISLIDRHE